MHKLNLFSTAALLGALAIGGANAAFAADEVGRVTAVAGEATAQQPGAEPRPLACGDPVFANDTLRTGRDSHIGLQQGDIATHLDASSQLVVGTTPQNTASARLIAGKVRMIDPRESGDPAQLSVLAADAHVQGNDAEGYIFSEKVGPYAMLCEWDQPLPVTRGNESKTAEPNHCVIAKPKEPLYTANAHDTRIPALAQECAPGPDLASLNSPLRHLTAEDVAAPGAPPGSNVAGFGNVNPAAAAGPAYAQCEVAGVCSPLVPIRATEPNPTPGCSGGPVACGP
jgi:hypothetical protein